MLVVRVELWPGGERIFARQIAQMRIGNISNLAPVSTYRIQASNSAAPRLGIRAFVAEGMTIEHCRRDAVWVLLAKSSARVAQAWEEATAKDS
jgi:hypothetical protein